MSTSQNPFDDESGIFYALVNDEGQYSLWPEFVPVPAGWSIEHGPGDRADCLAHIDTSWTDMRPKSLITRMTADGERHASA